MRRPTPLAPLYAESARGWMDLLGWRYPSEFAGAVTEHRTVRSRAGLVDLAFMAHVRVRGRAALECVQRLITNDAARLAPGAALYSPMCDPGGGLVDDCTVLRETGGAYLVTTGLRNTVAWIAAHAGDVEVEVDDVSDDLAVIAVPGPAAAVVLAAAGVRGVEDLGWFQAGSATLAKASVTLLRIDYSGERGYEILVRVADCADVWRALARHAPPCGGLALQSLRVEAGYLMTGADFDRSVRPDEVGLERFVRTGKGDFLGRDALRARRGDRRLVGLRWRGSVVVRPGAVVRDAVGRAAGRVTSSVASPTLGGVLAYALLDPDVGDPAVLAAEGVAGYAAVVALPFYETRTRRRACATAS